MKKIGIVMVVLVIALGISAVNSASAFDWEEIWEKYFPDDEIFDGGVFVNDTVETNVTEEQKELTDWLETDQRIFPPGWANETEHSNLPPGYFDVVPKEEFINSPPGYWDVDWGIKGVN